MDTSHTPPDEAVLAGMTAAQHRLIDHLGAAHAARSLVPRRPSRLPGWSIGHVLTHIARNADSITRALDGARVGRVEARYPGGAAQREADIALGADRWAADLLDDIRVSNARLEQALSTMTPEAWRGLCLATGGQQPVAELPLNRWREAEVHLSDVGLPGFTVDDWSPAFVAADLASLLETRGRAEPLLEPIAARPPARQLAWLHGRLPASGPAWDAATLRPNWRRPFTADEIDVLDEALRVFRQAEPELDLASMTDATFPIRRPLGHLIDDLRTQLVEGQGVAAYEGFPVERYSAEELRALWWGFSRALGTPVSQSRRGDLIGDVRDLGTGISGPIGRGYTSNAELNFHADASDIAGLFFLRTAKEGGVTRIASAITAHDMIARRRPDALAELYRELPWSWQGNQPEGTRAWYAMPVFGLVGDQISCAYVRTNILLAPQNAGAPELTPQQIEAVQMLVETASERGVWVEHTFEPGAMLFVHNHTTLHLRTAFVDWNEPERHRHLLRIWLSTPNGRQLPDTFGAFFHDLAAGSTRGGYPSADGRLVFSTQ